MTHDAPAIDLHLALDEAGLEALEGALLRARATELAEVRRRAVRFTAGYGDPTARGVLEDEGRQAERRYEALSAALDALRAARSGSAGG